MYSRCQINRPLYVLDNLITFRVCRFPDLFGNLVDFLICLVTSMIHPCKEVDLCDVDIYSYLLMFIPPWYL